MSGTSLILELVLIALLAATLFHAVRLERALGVLKRDRAALETLVAGFNTATRQAEAGVDRLRSAADGAGRQVARQTDAATVLKDDLVLLIERGETLADRLDRLGRQHRQEPTQPSSMWLDPAPSDAVQTALQSARAQSALPSQRGAVERAATTRWETAAARQAPRPTPRFVPDAFDVDGSDAAGSDDGINDSQTAPTGTARLRSKAERDLIAALRAAR